MRPRFVWIVLVILLPARAVALDSAVADRVDSVYSTLDWDACAVLDAPATGESGDWVSLRCDGIAGYQVHVTDSDQRMSLDYTAHRGSGPWESFSGFNHVHDVIEWRRQQGPDGRRAPFATIHRWFVGPTDHQRQMLVVQTVAERPGQESCMVGYIDATATPDANVVARRVADRHARGFVCGNAEVRAFGGINADTPHPHRASP